MQRIDIEKIKEDEEGFVFEVAVSGNDLPAPRTRQAGRVPPFTVSLKKDYYKKLTNKSITPEKLMENSFKFLLEREPIEAILKSFDLSVIASYFPEYEQEIRHK